MNKHTEWSFTSTIEQFDGERIQREALAAGLQQWSVTRDDRTECFCTVPLYERAERLGITVYGARRGSWIPVICHGRLWAGTGTLPAVMNLPEQVDLLTQVEAAEAARARTVVRGR